MTTEVKREAPKLGPNRLKLSEMARHHWVVDVEQGTSRQDVVDPAYWSMHSMRMSPMDIIEARWEDGTVWALFVVLGCDRTWAKVHEILWVDLSTGDVALTQSVAKYKIEWKGTQKKNCVIRTSDGAIVFEGGHRKVDAEAWLRDNEAHLT